MDWSSGNELGEESPDFRNISYIKSKGLGTFMGIRERYSNAEYCLRRLDSQPLINLEDWWKQKDKFFSGLRSYSK